MRVDPEKFRWLLTCSDRDLVDHLADMMESAGSAKVDRSRLLDIVKVERMGIINWILEPLKESK